MATNDAKQIAADAYRFETETFPDFETYRAVVDATATTLTAEVDR